MIRESDIQGVETLTVAKLRKILQSAGIRPPSKVRKPDLVQLVLMVQKSRILTNGELSKVLASAGVEVAVSSTKEERRKLVLSPGVIEELSKFQQDNSRKLKLECAILTMDFAKSCETYDKFENMKDLAPLEVVNVAADTGEPRQPLDYYSLASENPSDPIHDILLGLMYQNWGEKRLGVFRDLYIADTDMDHVDVNNKKFYVSGSLQCVIMLHENPVWADGVLDHPAPWQIVVLGPLGRQLMVLAQSDKEFIEEALPIAADQAFTLYSCGGPTMSASVPFGVYNKTHWIFGRVQNTSGAFCLEKSDPIPVQDRQMVHDALCNWFSKYARGQPRQDLPVYRGRENDMGHFMCVQARLWDDSGNHEYLPCLDNKADVIRMGIIEDNRWERRWPSPDFEVQVPEKMMENLKLINVYSDAFYMRSHMTAHEMLLHIAKIEGARLQSNVPHAPVTMESHERSEHYCEVFLTRPLELVLSKEGKRNRFLLVTSDPDLDLEDIAHQALVLCDIDMVDTVHCCYTSGRLWLFGQFERRRMMFTYRPISVLEGRQDDPQGSLLKVFTALRTSVRACWAS